VQESFTRNPEQIEVMELEGYSRPTRDKLCAPSYGALDRRGCSLQAPPSTIFVDDTIDLPWRNFLSPEFWAKFQSEEPLSLAVAKFPYNTV